MRRVTIIDTVWRSDSEAGDPVVDMECQVRANEVRVALLTKQNERLRATIAKLRALAASGRPPTRNHSRYSGDRVGRGGRRHSGPVGGHNSGHVPT